MIERFGPPDELARALDAEQGQSVAAGAAVTVALLALGYGLELLALAALGLWRQPAFEVHVVRGWAAPPVHLLAALTQGRTVVWAAALAAAAGALALTRFSSESRGARTAIALSALAAALLVGDSGARLRDDIRLRRLRPDEGRRDPLVRRAAGLAVAGARARAAGASGATRAASARLAL